MRMGCDVMNFLTVMFGGGIGAGLRYAISLIPSKGVFPILTLITNLLGAVAIGFIVGLAESSGMPERRLLFLKTGVCGGFTTFSTFSMEAWTLFECHHIGLGTLYVVLSVGLCLAGFALGRSICKSC